MKKAILLILLTTSCSSIYGQFYKNFFLEFGVNRTKVFNTSSYFPEFNNEFGAYRGARRDETPTYSNNFSLSAGISPHENHVFRVRYSKNTLGSRLTGTFTHWGWCGVGGANIRTLENALNEIKNESLGIMYEFNLPLSFGKATLGVGVEKQWNDYSDTFITIANSPRKNHALHSSLGFLIPMLKWLEIHPKIIMTRSFYNYDLNSEGSSYNSNTSPEYIPMQIGAEIGVRFRIQ